MKRFFSITAVCGCLCLFAACKIKSAPPEETLPIASVRAVQPVLGTIQREANFNGTTVHLKKSQVLSPVAGYVVAVHLRFGQEVRRGQLLFELITRETKALESVSEASGMAGKIQIAANADGFISDLNITDSGDFVPEGSTLCTIVNHKDLMIRLNVPYEDVHITGKERKCRIRLADQTEINGSVVRILPSVEGSTQTQTVLVKPETIRLLPENLNLILFFVREKHDNALLVPRSALMSDEKQKEFWVMRIVEGNTAIKVPVVKGIENDSLAEVVSPVLGSDDLIIFEGAYGLPDSTLVSIVK